MAADWDTSGIHERRVDERMAPEPRRGWLGGRGRLAGVLTGLVSVAIIVGYIWSGRDRPEHETGGKPPVIQADEAPVRVPPEQPGGMEIPHRDKLVLQRVPGIEEDPRRERLLPPPEEPLPPPGEEPAASFEPPAESLLPPPPARESPSLPPSPAAKAEPAPAKTEAPPVQARATEGPRPLTPEGQQSTATRSSGGGGPGSYVWPSETARSSEKSAGYSGYVPPRSSAGSASKTAPPRAAGTTTSYVLPPATAQASPTLDSGTYMVQLAAVSTAEQAQAAWSRLRGNNGDLLAGLSPSYARADLGSKGVVYRLRAGPLPGETKARALCAQLTGRKVDCMVVRAGG